MALTLPQPPDLATFWGDQDFDEDDDRANTIIQLSANLLWMATGLENDPTDTRLLFMVKLAIMDMAIFLFVTRDNIDAEYSPFVSEHIGSYSYAKTYTKATSQVAVGKATGAAIFDSLVSYLNLLAMGNWTSAESVYEHGYIPLSFLTWLENPMLVTGHLTIDGQRQDGIGLYRRIYNRDRTDY